VRAEFLNEEQVLRRLLSNSSVILSFNACHLSLVTGHWFMTREHWRQVKQTYEVSFSS
jgi:hypothetical protein